MRYCLKRKGFLEKAISTVIVLILLAVLVGLLIKQGRYDRDRFKIDSFASNQSSSEPFVDIIEIVSFIPDGLKPMSPAEIYDANTLYEKINGKAELYLESDFQHLWCRRFVSLLDSDDWSEVYIYDMSNFRNAFAVYAAQTRPEVQFLEFSDFAYKTQDALFLISGRYYVEIMNATGSEQIMKALQDFAVHFDDGIEANADAEQIYELHLFPTQHLRKYSFGFKTKNVFGFEELESTFVAGYEIDGEELTAFISTQPDHDAAINLARNYSRFLVNNGAVDQSKETEQAFGVFDFYGSIEIVFATGPYVAGIHGAEDINLAIELAKKLSDKLNESTQ